MAPLQRRKLDHVAPVHGDSLDRVPSGQRRQLRGVPHLQPSVFRRMPGAHHRLAAHRGRHRLLMLCHVPVGQLRMLGLVPPIKRFMLSEVLSGNPRVVIDVAMLEASMHARVALPDRTHNAVLRPHPDLLRFRYRTVPTLLGGQPGTVPFVSTAGSWESLRAAVAGTCRSLASAGLLIGTAGNVSARADDHVAVTATGVVLGRARPEHVTVVDLAGKVVAGDLEPTSELQMHLGIYRRYRAGAVVHTHSPLAVALSTVLEELPCIHYQLLDIGGAIRVAPFAPFGTPELAEHVLAALDGKSAALLANHGAITYGSTLDKAMDNALLLEWACGVYQKAATIGTPRALDAEQQAAARQAALRRGYGTIRKLTGEPSAPESR